MKTPTHLFLSLLLAAHLVFLDTGCGNVRDGAQTNVESEKNSNETDDKVPKPSEELFTEAPGVVQFVEGARAADRILLVFGVEGIPIKKIDRDDDSIGSLEGEDGDFFPLLFSNGAQRDFAIEMMALRRSRNWIEVVIHENKEPQRRGYIRADDRRFRFLEWREWVLGHFNIRFSADQNPVLDAPEGKPKTVELPKEPLIKPEEVKGDWVRIRWVRHEPDEPSVRDIARSHPDNEGWIRWRSKGKVVISEYYP